MSSSSQGQKEQQNETLGAGLATGGGDKELSHGTNRMTDSGGDENSGSIGSIGSITKHSLSSEGIDEQTQETNGDVLGADEINSNMVEHDQDSTLGYGGLGDNVNNLEALEGVTLSASYPEAQYELTTTTNNDSTTTNETEEHAGLSSWPTSSTAMHTALPTASNEQHIWDSFFAFASDELGGNQVEAVQSPISEDVQSPFFPQDTLEHAYLNQLFEPSASMINPSDESETPQPTTHQPTPSANTNESLPEITYNLSQIIANPHSNPPVTNTTALPLESMTGNIQFETVFGDSDVSATFSTDLVSLSADEDITIIDQYQRTHDICSFLRRWYSNSASFDESARMNWPDTSPRKWPRPSSVSQEELDDDRCDIQGIDWERHGTTRRKARNARQKLYVGKPTEQIATPPNTENFYQFRRMICETPVTLSHYQLRNVIGATSNTDIVYACNSQVMHSDAVDGSSKCLMDLSHLSQYDEMHGSMVITSLAARDGIVIAGGLQGEYAISNIFASPSISSPDISNNITASSSTSFPRLPSIASIPSQPLVGYVTRCFNAITNHISIFPHRNSNIPHAAFCSNDQRVRIFDTGTAKFTDTFSYQYPINCSATSPCGRLRAFVGDTEDALITDASSGQVLTELRHHKDHAFAAAWSDDGIHVATAAQDCQLVVYDARFWQRPLARYGSQLGCFRSLHFTPLGSGPSVLIAAEADDGMTVIDAHRFGSGQVLDWFGGTAGVAIPPDGESVWVANCDAKFGGLLQFDRTGWGKGMGADGLAEWELVGYDGGDEYGVISDSAARAEKSEITTSMTVNRPTIDTTKTLRTEHAGHFFDHSDKEDDADGPSHVRNSNINYDISLFETTLDNGVKTGIDNTDYTNDNSVKSRIFNNEIKHHTKDGDAVFDFMNFTGASLGFRDEADGSSGSGSRSGSSSDFLSSNYDSVDTDSESIDNYHQPFRSALTNNTIATSKRNLNKGFGSGRADGYSATSAMCIEEESSGGELEDYFNTDERVRRPWRRRIRRGALLEEVML